MNRYQLAQTTIPGGADPWAYSIAGPLHAAGSGAWLDPKRSIRTPADVDPIVARRAAAEQERQAVAAALARLEGSKDRRAPAAREALKAALARAEDRVAVLDSLGADLAAREAAYRAAVARAAEATEAKRTCEPGEAVERAAAVEVCAAEVRAAWREGQSLVEAWRGTAAPACPELAAAQSRRDRLAAFLTDQVGPLASELAGDPLACALAPLAAPAALGKLLAGEPPPEPPPEPEP